MTDLKSNKKSWLSSAMASFSAIDLLKDHIAKHHSGNTSAFARTQHVSESQARRWLKRNCMVIDGVVYCEVSKQDKINGDK
jgi:hypothetical protein